MISLEQVIQDYLGERDIDDEAVTAKVLDRLKDMDFGGGEDWELAMKAEEAIERVLKGIDSPSDLTLNQYQDRTADTVIYPKEMALIYLSLGLSSESGEVADQLKKAIRDDGSDGVALREEREEAILDELGDVLWYVAQLANELNCDLSTIASRNLAKLQARHSKN